MFDDLMRFGERVSPYVYVPMLAVAAGVAVLLWTAWDLITGGPRAKKNPGTPLLYDRLYFALQLFTVFALTCAPAAFLLETVTGKSVDGGNLLFFVLALMFLSVGLRNSLRGDMMYRAAKYLAEWGAWWQRPVYRLWAIRYDYYSAIGSKRIAAVYGVLGVAIIIYYWPHLPDSIEQVCIGARGVMSLLAAPEAHS